MIIEVKFKPHAAIVVDTGWIEQNMLYDSDDFLNIMDSYLRITEYTTNGLRILADEIKDFRNALHWKLPVYEGQMFSYVEYTEEQSATSAG